MQQFLSAGYIFNNSSSLKDVKQLNPGETIEIIEDSIVNTFQQDQKVFDDSAKKKLIISQSMWEIKLLKLWIDS